MTRLDIISDFVCPWCYIGKVNLETALIARPAHPFQIHWRPFQLDPNIPPEGLDRQTYMERKFGGSEPLEASYDRLRAMGEAAGITFRFDRITLSPNSFDAHRLVRWAEPAALQTVVAGELFRRYFEEGEDISDPAVLTAAAAAAGLDPELIARLLRGDAERDTIRAEIDEAGAMGVTGVPTFILAREYALSGAQPPEIWSKVMDDLEAATA